MGMLLHGSPMVGLLARQAHRRGFDRYRRWTMFAILLFLAPAVTAVSLDRYSESLEAFLITLAGALALVVPLAQLAGDASLLASLRKGGCLEEILGTRTSTREIVDQVAAYSVSSVLRMGFAVLVPVVLGLLLLVPNRLAVLLAGLCWLPAMTVVVWAGSCLVQAVIAWSDRGRISAPAVLVALPLLAGVALTLHGASAEMGDRAYLRAALVALFATALVGVVSRALACWGLERSTQVGARLRHAWRTGPHRPPVLWRNAIALRESARERLGTPGGLLGHLLLHYWVLWLGLALVAWNVHLLQYASLHKPALLLWSMLVMAAGFLQPLRASIRTVGAVNSEKDGRTLETLATSGLAPEAFVDGWAQASWLPRCAETALLLAGGALLLTADGGTAASLLAVPDLLLRLVYGAYLGLLVSTTARARRDAWTGLLFAWIASVLALFTGPGILSALLMVVLIPLEMPEVAMAGSVFVHMGATVCGILLVRYLCVARVRALFAPRA